MNQTSLAISLILVAGTLLLASIAIPSAYADKNCVNCKNRIGGNQDNSESTTNNVDNSVNNVDNSVNNVDNSVNNVDNSVTTTCRDVTGNNAACNG
jgi:peptidoglycan hydrolase CwlO-like protein